MSLLVQEAEFSLRKDIALIRGSAEPGCRQFVILRDALAALVQIAGPGHRGRVAEFRDRFELPCRLVEAPSAVGAFRRREAGTRRLDSSVGPDRLEHGEHGYTGEKQGR